MQKFTKPISLFKQRKLNMSEYCIFRRDMREYNLINNKPIKGIRLRKIIYPAVRFAVKIDRLLNKHTLYVVNDKRIKTSNPIIFCVTHQGRYDIERVFEPCGISCWVFNGDPETVYRNFDGFALNMSGVILVDTDSKSDRHIALETAIKLLKSGGNLMFFPEGIWNTEPSLPVLPLYKGIVEIALRSGAYTVPVALERYENTYEINIGENISADKLKEYTTENALNIIRDSLATLKWEIFERHKCSRKVFPQDLTRYWNDRVDFILNEWTDKNSKSHYSRELLEKRKFRAKDITLYEQAFEHLKRLTPTLNNAFLFNKRNHN